MVDRYDLYELCVQAPDDVVRVLRALHGRDPAVLAEDFCGTARISAAWVRSAPDATAIATDHDSEALQRAETHERIVLVAGDVVADTDAAQRADVLYAGNFSIGYWHTRADLLRYLRHARHRLRAGGVFACDIYGGESAFLTGSIERELALPEGRTVIYTWEQREADPLTGLVTNVLHFEVRCDDAVEQTLREAFVYRWRLWGVPELRDAMLEAGFARPEVFARMPAAIDEESRAYVLPIEDAAELDDSFDVLVVARV